MRRHSSYDEPRVRVEQTQRRGSSGPCSRLCCFASVRFRGTSKRTPLLSWRSDQCGAKPCNRCDDRDLEGLIERALAHATRTLRGLARELDRRVRAWIMANSALGAGALHNWAAGDDQAARLPQQTLNSWRPSSTKLRLAWGLTDGAREIWRTLHCRGLQPWQVCERELAWPPQLLGIFTSLLAKSDVDQRPIAVAPLLYRLWP